MVPFAKPQLLWDSAVTRKEGYIEEPACPPLINIGTYVYSKSIDALVGQWLEFCEQQDTVCQIIRRGAIKGSGV